MATAPGQNPPGGGKVSGGGAPDAAGAYGGEVSTQPGQYPARLFGVALPQGTGAPGSAGAGRSADPANQPGQLNEGISGLGPADTADTGAPGSQGAGSGSGSADSVTYTWPGSFLTGTNQSDTVRDDISGTGDWTQAHPGSYGGNLNLPGIDGNQPTSTGAGQGRVLRGGRRVR
ncbi:MAG TPA: hypothetical protein VF506_10900 [Streptosporangiaceae bacterium]